MFTHRKFLESTMTFCTIILVSLILYSHAVTVSPALTVIASILCLGLFTYRIVIKKLYPIYQANTVKPSSMFEAVDKFASEETLNEMTQVFILWLGLMVLLTGTVWSVIWFIPVVGLLQIAVHSQHKGDILAAMAFSASLIKTDAEISKMNDTLLGVDLRDEDPYLVNGRLELEAVRYNDSQDALDAQTEEKEEVKDDKKDSDDD